MLINIVLILLVFGAAKKKINPYLCAGALGILKAAFIMILTHNVLLAVTNGLIYGFLALGFVYFLRRIGHKEPAGPSYGSPGAKRGGASFIWEYIPAAFFLVMMVAGEILINMLRIQTS